MNGLSHRSLVSVYWMRLGAEGSRTMTSMSSPVRKALGYVSLRWKDPIVCESCGNDFKCGATLTGCWCMNVKLTDETRASLRERYKKCLCKTCLERESAATAQTR